MHICRLTCVASAVAIALAASAPPKECAVVDEVSMMQQSSALEKKRGAVAMAAAQEEQPIHIDETLFPLADGTSQLEEDSETSKVEISDAEKEAEKEADDRQAVIKGIIIANLGSYQGWAVLQLIFALFYICLYLSKVEDGRLDLQEEKPVAHDNVIARTFANESNICNICMAFCCPGPRGAHTMVQTGVCKGLCPCGPKGRFLPLTCVIACFPCCSICIAYQFTDLRKKLYGMSDGEHNELKGRWFTTCLLACCCWPCVIAADSQSDNIINLEKEKGGEHLYNPCFDKCGTIGNPFGCCGQTASQESPPEYQTNS